MNNINPGQTESSSDDKIMRYIDRMKQETDFKIEMLNKKIQQLRNVVSQLKGGSE